MTIIFSKKCEYGLQAVLYLAAHKEKGVIRVDDIAAKLKVPIPGTFRGLLLGDHRRGPRR